MTLLFFDGFEAGNGVGKPEWNGTAIANMGINATFARTGFGYLVASTATAQILTLPASAKITLGVAAIVSSTRIGHITLMGDAAATSHLTVSYTAGGAIVLRLGNSTGTIIATAAEIFPLDTFRSLQIQATIADAGGRCTVKLDGATIIDYTGDTKNAGTSTNIDALNFISNGSGTGGRWDDLWVCDGVDATATQGRTNNDFLGDLAVSFIVPDAAGDTTVWTPSTAVANWTTVDETASPNTTDYVASATAAQRDLYNMQALPGTATTVYGVQVGFYASKSDAGAASVSPTIKELTGAGVTVGTAQAMSTTWAGYFGNRYYVKPVAGGVWSVADVNGLQAGVDAA